MKRVRVTFKYIGDIPMIHKFFGTLNYIVDSNNIKMGIAKAQYSLWKDLKDVPSSIYGWQMIGVSRFNYKTIKASFV